jgi:hypothetical protein
MERLAQEITEVEGEIKNLADEIKKVQIDLNAATEKGDIDAIKFFREEKLRLRDEKGRLHDKELRLHDEKLLLMKRADAGLRSSQMFSSLIE